MTELATVWFEESKTLDVGEALFFRVANKKEQVDLASDFEKLKEEYAAIDPERAGQLFVNKILKDLKQYVTIERKYRAVFTAFKRDKEGNFTKFTIDPDRRRLLKVMIADGKSREEIEDHLNGLTEQEAEEFFPTRK
ncbi:MAG: hypothetical protein WC194_10340 [Mesotoga sp.]|uniref:hypothetical protein n=1 Tax=Mesotoga sp. TaxID=2053577 RepID=UPI00356654DA